MTKLNEDQAPPQLQAVPDTAPQTAPQTLAYGDTLMVVVVDDYSEQMVKRVFADGYRNSHFVDSKAPIRKTVASMEIKRKLEGSERQYLNNTVFQLMCGYRGADFINSYIEYSLVETVDIITIAKRAFNIIMVDARLIPASLIHRFKTHKILLTQEGSETPESLSTLACLRHSGSTANITRTAKSYMRDLDFDL